MGVGRCDGQLFASSYCMVSALDTLYCGLWPAMSKKRVAWRLTTLCGPGCTTARFGVPDGVNAKKFILEVLYAI